MNFRKVNNITGWAVFLAALATYMLTREARGSLWDSGEFIASAQKLQLPHPPGAPVFVLLGRFFIILFGDNGHDGRQCRQFHESHWPVPLLSCFFSGVSLTLPAKCL